MDCRTIVAIDQSAIDCVLDQKQRKIGSQKQINTHRYLLYCVSHR